MSLTRRAALALPLVALIPFVPVLAEANVPEAVTLGSDWVMITTMFVVKPGDWGDGSGRQQWVEVEAKWSQAMTAIRAQARLQRLTIDTEAGVSVYLLEERQVAPDRIRLTEWLTEDGFEPKSLGCDVDFAFDRTRADHTSKAAESRLLAFRQHLCDQQRHVPVEQLSEWHRHMHDRRDDELRFVRVTMWTL